MRARRPLVPTVLVMFVATLVLQMPSAAAATSVFVLDGEGGAAGRTAHLIGAETAATIFDGHPYVFSYDATAGNLRVGWRTDG